MKYRPHLDLTLKDLTFTVNPGEKIGIVGRTGSGKSSTLLTLFRMVELFSGRIVIDGVDISSIGLFDLRSRLSLKIQQSSRGRLGVTSIHSIIFQTIKFGTN
jgi:ATP-binding cassette subfamily C (CFTR/MRP) protein 1